MDDKGFCTTPFWNWTLTTHPNRPDFTDCFHQTLPLYIPCLYLWLLLPYYVWLSKDIRKRKKKTDLEQKTEGAWHVRPKLLTVLALCLTTVAGLVYTITTVASQSGAVSYVTPVLVLITLLYDGACLRLHQLAEHCCSWAQFYFWALMTVLGVPTFVSSLRLVFFLDDDEVDGSARAMGITRLVYFFLSLVLLALHCVSEAPKDQSSVRQLRRRPEERAAPLAYVFYSWLDSLIWRGYKSPLQIDGIPKLLPDLTAKRIRHELDRQLNIGLNVFNRKVGQCNPAIEGVEEKGPDIADDEDIDDVSVAFESDEDVARETKVNIVLPMLKAFGFPFFVGILLKLAQDMLKFVGPQILKQLIRFVQSSKGSESGKDDDGAWQGYFLACALFSINVLAMVVLQNYWKRTYTTGLKMRVAAISAIYRKALRLSSDARRSYSVGQIVNLMVSDTQAIRETLPSVNMTWSMPLQITMALYFLYRELGVALIGGVAVLLLLIPFNIWSGQLVKKYQAGQMKCRDGRIKALYDILASMKVIKYNALEPAFQEKVAEHRAREVAYLKKNALLKAFVNFVFNSAPIIVMLASFGTYVTMDKERNLLTADKVFVCIALFNLLRLPMNLLPHGIVETLRLVVSVKRINQFLSSQMLANRPRSIDKASEGTDNVIEVRNGSFSWGSGESPVLHDIQLSVPRGSLVAVVGQVGAGKSTLLSALLGDTETVSHDGGGEAVTVRAESTAYVSQQPWIQNMTVKQNILFGRKKEEAWYRQVVSSCALEDDLAQLMDGEDTEIGENGINLSGGQKQRVSIARAAYRKADLYLFDDPLSALDSHTSSHVFDGVIGNDGLLKDKTRVLVTHRTNVVNKADYVLVLKEGRVVSFGLTREILRSGSELSLLMNEVLDDQGTKEDESEQNMKRTQTNAKIADATKTETRADKKKADAAKRLKDEDVLTGRVRLQAYAKYFSSIGYINTLFIIVLYLINQSVSTGSMVWMAKWSDDTEQSLAQGLNSNSTSSDSSNPEMQHSSGFYIGILGAFGVSQGVASFTRNWFFFSVCARGSILMHNNLFKAIMRARMRFFDTTPTGSVVNRLSSDMHAVDLTFPQALSAFFFTTFEVTAVFVVISFSSPFFLILIPPLGVIYYGLIRFYIPSSRQLQRFEANTKSPINLHFSETVTGVNTIRAFDEQERFLGELEERADANMRAQYISLMLMRWLTLRGELIGNLVVLLAGCLAVHQRDVLTAGWIGLMVSYAMSITEVFNWVLQNGTRLEVQAVSIERIREMEKYTPQEAAWRNEQDDPKEDKWLKRGQVEMKGLILRYAPELEDVLHGLTLTIRGGEKVGVCGRTGAGKSSLSAGLFNLVESWDGSILLDGVDIKKIGLHTLRTQLTIIPQDPILFEGSVRYNVDPLGMHHDEKVWEVLEQSHMKKVVAELQDGLDHTVEEGGSNFSVGQRQLLCLSRALLRDSQIVMLDEATASMDAQTDEHVQETLFRQLKGKTLITIAHRLDTILNYDRILVMDRGRIKEFDTPENLLANKSSQFYSMMEQDRKE